MEKKNVFSKEDTFEDVVEETKAQDNLNKTLSIRVVQADFEFIKEHRISATKFFNFCLHRLIKMEK